MAVPKTLLGEKVWASCLCTAPSDPRVTMKAASVIVIRPSITLGDPRAECGGQGPSICLGPLESRACPGCALQSSWWDPGSCVSSIVCPSVCLGCLGKVKHCVLRGQIFWRGKKAICGCVVCLIKSVTGLGYTMCTLNQSQLALLANAAFHSWETALGELL